MSAPFDRMRPLPQRELVIDNFAGGGGASTGISLALGFDPDIAINHDPEAIAMHAANHPTTRHYCENVWNVDPHEATQGRPIGFAWFSPDCKHFSKAKGGKPVDKQIRGLAWIVIKYARLPNKPRVIALENVEEFQDWGPVLPDGRPDPFKRGLTFKRWLGQLKACGYEVDMRELRASDYGVPTSRKRLFIIARCDGLPIRWPEPTHGEGRAFPHLTAASCIDWTIPCPSIFERDRDLAENTKRRIAHGIMRYVVEDKDPFIIPTTHAGDARTHGIHEPMRTITGAHRGEHALVGATLIQTGYGERPGQAPRVPGLHKPLGTLVSGTKHALVTAFLARHYGDRTKTGGGFNGGVRANKPAPTITARDHTSLVTSHLLALRNNVDAADMRSPMPTVCAGGTHFGEVRAFLLKYYGTSTAAGLAEPLDTVTARDRFGLVIVPVDGVDYVLADIGMRMLTPRELYRAQGFPSDYKIDFEYEGAPLTKTAQVRMCGNSVCPPLAAAIVRANYTPQALEVAA